MRRGATDGVEYECDECQRVFTFRDECHEHLLEEHEILDRYTRVNDPANDEKDERRLDDAQM